VIEPRLVGAIGAITGFAESTAGWAITWRIGPGRVPGTTPARIAVAVASMTAFGFGLALIGAWIFVLVLGAFIHARR
jgi:hypothetical protein